MKNKVFISGSISIKKLSQKIIDIVNNIIEQKFEILVGDAEGVDTLIQNYCLSLKYYNVRIYSISKFPRYNASKNFKVKYIEVSHNNKNKRELQQEKDKVMTLDSKFTFTIWNSKSKGSYDNILRGLNNNKKVKIYLSNKGLYLNNPTKNEIESIYRESNGYTASEVVKYLKNEAKKEFFNKAQDLNKYLMKKLIIQKINTSYIPTNKYQNLFIISKYHGKITGCKFKNEFIPWIENRIKKEVGLQQASLF